MKTNKKLMCVCQTDSAKEAEKAFKLYDSTGKNTRMTVKKVDGKISYSVWVGK